MAAWYFICSLVYKKDSQLVVRNYCRFKFNRQALLSHSIDETLQLVSTVSRVRDQAGNQRRKSCEELVMTLCHLCDCGKREKIKLLVSLVDFSTAYD